MTGPVRPPAASPFRVLARPFLVIAFAACLALAARPERAVRYFQTGPVYEYRVKLLELVLAKTDAGYGKAIPTPAFESVTQARGLDLLEAGSVDIAMLPTTREREARFRAVRVDILRGILGYRVFLIKAGRQKDFLAVRNRNDLAKFEGGFGAQWADMQILLDGGLDVVGVAETSSLIAMLDIGRFDYYPRGINEAWVELDANKATYPDLAVESGLALLYPYPVYFFVRKDDVALAERLSRGLAMALSDGSFKELFLRYHKDLLARANLGGRRIIRLENRGLPVDTPPIDTSWWLAEGR